MPPGERIPEHDGIHRLIYSLAPYSITYTSDELGTLERTFATGDVHWHKPSKHALENTGDTVARYLVFAMKN